MLSMSACRSLSAALSMNFCHILSFNYLLSTCIVVTDCGYIVSGLALLEKTPKKGAEAKTPSDVRRVKTPKSAETTPKKPESE